MVMSPYASVGPRLVQLGYSAIPIAPGSKYPGQWLRGAGYRPMSAWSQFCTRLPTLDETTTWSQWPNAGVGIATGSASRVVALDFDTRPEFWSAIESVIETSPLIKRGQKGYTAFYRYGGQATKQFILPGDSVPTIEILSIGRQSVIPPTPHPDMDGRCYQWDDADLFTLTPDELPVLPEEIDRTIEEILGIERRTPSTTSPPAGDGFIPSPEMAEEMLKYIDPHVSASRWIAIGSSLKSAYPDEVAFDLWNLWSSRDKREWRKGIPQYQPSRMYRRWQGIDPSVKGVTIGTFIDAAKDGGFRSWWTDEDRALAHVSPDLDPPKRETIIVTDAVIPTPPAVISHDTATAAPGLVGAIAKWIVETAVVPQPVLALGAALAFVGAIKGKRARTRTNLRTNIYVLGLGGSGSGKNHPIDALQYLHMHIYGVKPGLLLDRPRSDAGLITGMSERDGRCLLLWDEIGQEIRAMCSDYSSPHRAGIMTVFTEAFSSAGRVLQGQQLASINRASINQPCLCVYGTTVPERFFESLSAESVIDGFLSRWLVFQCENDLPDESDTAEITSPPGWMVRRLKEIDEARPWNGVDLDTPPRVPYSEVGDRFYRELKSEFREKARAASTAFKTAVPIWIRAAEHVAKIALIITDGDETTERELRWAKSLVDAQCQNMVHLVETRISQNEQEKNTKRILRHIGDAGATGLSKSRLTNLTFDLTRRERDDLIETLVESGRVIAEPAQGRGSGRRALVFRLT